MSFLSPLISGARELPGFPSGITYGLLGAQKSGIEEDQETLKRSFVDVLLDSSSNATPVLSESI